MMQCMVKEHSRIMSGIVILETGVTIKDLEKGLISLQETRRMFWLIQITCFIMEAGTLVSGKKTSFMEKDRLNILMETHMMDNGIWIIGKERAFLLAVMVNITMENGLKMVKMVLEKWILLAVIGM